MSERHKPGICAGCKGATSRYDRVRCLKCYHLIAEQAAAEEPDEFDELDAKLLANGRCDVCRLLLPCGGHVTATFYAHLSREVNDG